MTVERCKDAWQHRPLDTESERREDATTAIEHRVRKLDRHVFRRDFIETIAAVGVIAFFSVVAWRPASSLTRAGAIFTGVAAVFIVLHFHRTRRETRPPGPDLPLNEFCRRARDRVDAQIRLLRSVLWWYILPLLIGVNLVVAGAASPTFAAVYAATTIAFGALLYWLNQRAAATLAGLRRELNGSVQSFERNGEAGPSHAGIRR
ncbi:MAG: hypothetical protein GEU99_21490 [Luteitalea sp.]|nr:hypothetical protein [Luteitalea sp.]